MAMPRPERSIDASEGPIAKFAVDLRQLRAESGITYRDLADRAHFSKATLSAAAAGHRLPTWEVTQAYVEACGGDVEVWRERWEAVRVELGWPAGNTDESLPDIESPPSISASSRRGRAIVVTVAAVVVGIFITTLVWTRIDASTPKTKALSPSATPRYASTLQPVADNNDPKKTGCAADVNVADLDKVDIETATDNLLGIAELRYSPKCHAAWGRFEPSGRMMYFKKAIVTIIAFRPSTGTSGTPYSTQFDGQDAYGNILTTRKGCVDITIIISAPTGSGRRTTWCRR
jgi:transcriptional regulator with XRE-family HTH domain